MSGKSRLPFHCTTLQVFRSLSEYEFATFYFDEKTWEIAIRTYCTDRFMKPKKNGGLFTVTFGDKVTTLAFDNIFTRIRNQMLGEPEYQEIVY